MLPKRFIVSVMTALFGFALLACHKPESEAEASARTLDIMSNMFGTTFRTEPSVITLRNQTTEAQRWSFGIVNVLLDISPPRIGCGLARIHPADQAVTNSGEDTAIHKCLDGHGGGVGDGFSLLAGVVPPHQQPA